MATLKNFVNRTSELAAIDSLLTRNHPAGSIVWRSRPATGMSALLRQSSKVYSKDATSLYVDCSNRVANSVFAQLILQIFEGHKQLWSRFQKTIDSRLSNDRTRNLTKSALAGLPWVGPLLGAALEEAAPFIELSNYPSATAEIVCEFLLKESESQPFLICLDNCQDLDPWSTDLLSTTLGSAYARVLFVSGFVERSESQLKFGDFRRKFSLLSGELSHDELEVPDARMVMELAQADGVELSSQAAEAIQAAADGNIYQILLGISKLRGETSSNSYQVLETPLARELISVLSVANQGLRESDLVTICTNENLYLESEEMASGLVDVLAGLGLLTIANLPDGDRLINLERGAIGQSRITMIAGSEGQRLVVAKHIYDFYLRAERLSKRHSPSEISPLLYRISKIIAPDETSRHMQALLEISLRMGSSAAAERFIGKATKPRPTVQGAQGLEDFITHASFLLSLRRYRDCLAFVYSAGERGWHSNRTVQIIESIALNRSRHHEKANRRFVELLNTSQSPEEIALIGAYKIAGELHTNKVSAAQATFRKYRSAAASAKNFAYFLRNGADAFSGNKAVDLLTEAAARFRNADEPFGLASCLSNRSGHLSQLGETARALEDAQEAYSILEVFGIHHLHIVSNNLGVAHLMERRFDEALDALGRSLRLGRNRIPKIYASVNIAMARALMGARSDAKATIKQLETEVANHRVDRVRQKFYMNAVLILSACGSPDAELEFYIQKAREFPDRYSSDRTEALLSAAEESRARAAGIESKHEWSIFDPCLLLYWYQNPLEGLPKDVLSMQTME